MSKLLSLLGNSMKGGWALKWLADRSYTVSAPGKFGEWADRASASTGSSTMMVFTNPSTTLRFQIDAQGASGDKCSVWWDDGTTSDYTLSGTNTNVFIGKTYSTAANRVIVVMGADHITRIRSQYYDGRTNFGGVVTEWTWMTSIDVWSGNTLSGSVTNLTGLTLLRVGGNNTLSGSVTNLTGLTYLEIWGGNTLSGSVTDLTKLTYLAVGGSNTLSGSVTNLTNLTRLDVEGSNTVSGSLANLTNLTWLNVKGNNTISGSLANLTKLTYLYVLGYNTLSDFDVLASAATGLCYFRMNNALNEPTVNGILAGFWANRDEAKPLSYRTIDLNDNAASAAPTGQGLIDKANLQAYRSPGNNPSYPLWTVYTN